MPGAAAHTVWFPDGIDVTPRVAFSPVTSQWLPNVQLMQRAPDPPRPSDEQGIGKPPFLQWPSMPHTEQYSFESLSNQGWHPLEDGIRAEREGWSAPVYYEQAAIAHHVWPGPVSIEEPVTVPYTDLTAVPA